MFLQVMNQEEKEKFLELVYKVANIDGEYAEEEQEIVNSYKKELELETIADTCNIEELVDFFSAKNETLRKIILFEIIGLINADDKIEKSESYLLNTMIKKFEVSNEACNKIGKVAKKLQDVYDEIYDVLFD